MVYQNVTESECYIGNSIYLFNENFERLGVVQVNLGVDIEVEVALLFHADLNCGRPRSIFRDGLPVQDLDGIVPKLGIRSSLRKRR